MKIFLWLIAGTSLPTLLLTLVLAFNWGAVWNDAVSETTSGVSKTVSASKDTLNRLADSELGKYLPIENKEDAETENVTDTVCQVYQGKVVSISDGDTLTVLDNKKKQHKIRLRGIDAPESAQDFGARSKENLSRLVFGREVRVETCANDFYKREISEVRINDHSVNLAQLESGMAHYYKKYASNLSKPDRVLFAEAESSARRDQKGLWINPKPMLPEDFRRFARKP